MPDQEVIAGVYSRTRWRSHESDEPYLIGQLEDETTVQGRADDTALTPGITYEFYGVWKEHPKHGRSFKFSTFVVKIPHSRHGILAYLQKYCDGIGPVVASRIYDRFGADSVKILRTDPRKVFEANVSRTGFTLEKAIAASHALEHMAFLEDAKIGLTNLFHGRGFPGVLVDECVDKWKVRAPEIVTRDPFTLLVHGMSGCGFSRCDKLYTDLGLPPDRLKRQMICLWHALNSDATGDTWTLATLAVDKLKQLVSGTEVRPAKALKLGLRSKWIASHRDSQGILWLAEGERARNERYVAKKVGELLAWTPLDRSLE